MRKGPGGCITGSNQQITRVGVEGISFWGKGLLACIKNQSFHPNKGGFDPKGGTVRRGICYFFWVPLAPSPGCRCRRPGPFDFLGL